MKCAIDLVCLSLHQHGVAVLLARSSRGALQLPSALLTSRESLESGAVALTRRTLSAKPRWLEQAGAHTVDRHPRGAQLTVTFVTASPDDAVDERAFAWCSASRLPPTLPACHRLAVAASLEHIRARADLSPAVLALLPSEFTLTQLQRAYEVLLRRTLHKASFRRTIRTARLIIPTTAWRSEGRGRPAQLYRHASRATLADAGAVPSAPFRAPARRRRPRRDTTRA